MEKVYIISRYRADTAEQLALNKLVARHYARVLVSEGKIPVAPHIFYTEFLDDTDEEERRLGLNLGLKALAECDEFLMVIIDGVISEGMKGELRYIQEHMPGMRGRVEYHTSDEIRELL